MASDGLNQVGKYLRQTRKDVGYALSRTYSKNPTIERTRDVFDASDPFIMTFKVENGRNTVRLDLFLNKPPPLSACGGGCEKGACESFTTGSGTFLLTVSNEYLSGSVIVFVNGSSWNNFSEYSEDKIYVYSVPRYQNAITICYYYNDC